MENVIKLRSRVNDFGNTVTEQRVYNVLNMVPKGEEPFVDALLCSVEGMWETVFPFTLTTPYSYRVSDTFIDPSGGPMIQKGQTLTEYEFFKHRQSEPSEEQKVGCKKHGSKEQDNTQPYIEKDKIVVDVITSGKITVILLKDVE